MVAEVDYELKLWSQRWTTTTDFGAGAVFLACERYRHIVFIARSLFFFFKTARLQSQCNTHAALLLV